MTQKKLHELLAEVMHEVAYVQKDAYNKQQGYKFASAKAVLTKVNTALSARGVSVGSEAELLHFLVSEVDARGGGKRTRIDAVVRITLKFIRNLEMISVQGIGEGMDGGDKAVMKANTAALKYAVSNAFLVSWGDDPEADEATDAFVTDTQPPPKPAEPEKDPSDPYEFAGRLGACENPSDLAAIVQEMGDAGLTKQQREMLIPIYETAKKRLGQ